MRIGKTPGNKYSKGSGRANDAEWTKNGVNVEREEEMTLENKREDAEPGRKKKRSDKKNRSQLSAWCTRAKVARE
jgi:hypothetical protein